MGKGPAKHIPQRSCIACKETQEKRSLIRIVYTDDGIKIDPTGKYPGRGAYLHNNQECWEKAISKGILSRSLKKELTDADIECLKEWLQLLPKA